MLLAAAIPSIALSPGEAALDMIADILDKPETDVRGKLGVLRELCVERITFSSPQQAAKIISMLADIVLSNPGAEIRVAALEAMERMIGLEEKAENEQGKPAIDWRKINLLLRKARKKTELDTMAVPSRFAPPAPETASGGVPDNFKIVEKESSPEAHPAARDESDISPAEAALLAVQESAVDAVKKADVPVVAPSPEMLGAGPAPAAASAPASPVPDRPQPSTASRPAEMEEKPELPIMKFLRSVADEDEEEHIRELAAKIMTRIENLTAQKPPAAPEPTLQKG